MFLMFLCISILPTYNDIVSFLSLTFSHLVPVTAHPRILWKELIFILEYFMNINSVTLLILICDIMCYVMNLAAVTAASYYMTVPSSQSLLYTMNNGTLFKRW